MTKNNEGCKYDPKKIFDDGDAFWRAAGRCQEPRKMRTLYKKPFAEKGLIM